MSIAELYIHSITKKSIALYSSGSRILVRGGEKLGQNFIHEFFTSHYTAMASPKFRWGGGRKFSKKCNHKRLLKNL